MSLNNYSHEEKKQMPMVELADILLYERKEAIPFNELYEEVSELKEFSGEQKKMNIGQFYTDLNIEGRFMNVGSNMWTLRRWYPVEQAKNETKHTPKKKTKKKPAKKRQPEKAEVETNEATEDPATKNSENNDLEELTGDFSAFEGEDDLDDEESQFDLFDEELEIDENYEHESDDDEFDTDDEMEEDEEDDAQDAETDEEDKESAQ